MDRCCNIYLDLAPSSAKRCRESRARISLTSYNSSLRVFLGYTGLRKEPVRNAETFNLGHLVALGREKVPLRLHRDLKSLITCEARDRIDALSIKMCEIITRHDARDIYINSWRIASSTLLAAKRQRRAFEWQKLLGIQCIGLSVRLPSRDPERKRCLRPTTEKVLLTPWDFK